MATQRPQRKVPLEIRQKIIYLTLEKSTLAPTPQCPNPSEPLTRSFDALYQVFGDDVLDPAKMLHDTLANSAQSLDGAIKVVVDLINCGEDARVKAKSQGDQDEVRSYENAFESLADMEVDMVDTMAMLDRCRKRLGKALSAKQPDLVLTAKTPGRVDFEGMFNRMGITFVL